MGVGDYSSTESENKVVPGTPEIQLGFARGSPAAHDIQTQAIQRIMADLKTFSDSVGGGGGAALLVANNLSDLDNASTARSNLGLAIGSNVQAYDAALSSLAGLSLAAGDILYVTGADTIARLAKGTAGQTLKMNAGATAPEWGASAGGGGGAPDFYAEDQKSSGTDGGTFTSGAWRTRDLNTEIRNEIAGASLATNQITLPAGTYWVKALATARAVNNHVLKLYDATNTADLIIGLSARAGSTGQNATDACLEGSFTLSGSAALELRHYCVTTASTTGFGGDGPAAVTNVYAQIAIWTIS